MQVIIGVISVFGAAGTIIFLSFLNMNGGVKATLVAEISKEAHISQDT